MPRKVTLRYWIMRSMGSRLNSKNELLSLMEYRAVSSASSGTRVLLYRRASDSRARSCQLTSPGKAVAGRPQH